MQSIQEMIHMLEQHDHVVGLIEYGGNTFTETITTGDYDLLVVLSTPYAEVTSLHFDVENVPVDLSLLWYTELQQMLPNMGFESQMIVEGRVIYDPTGNIRCQQERLQQESTTSQREPWSDHTIAFIRHGHRHILDKVRNRLDTMPTLCHLLLSTNIYWLLENYFRLRYLPGRGPKQALSYLQIHDRILYDLIETFYAAPTLAEEVTLSQKMTDIVLAPVGGAWRKDEILAFGEEESQDLQRRGQEVYAALFGLSKSP